MDGDTWNEDLTMVRGSVHLSLLVAAAMTLPAPAALAQQPDLNTTRARAKPSTSATAQKPKPVARRSATPCSEYGAGFVRMAGSDTCVRIGGSVDVGAGFGR